MGKFVIKTRAIELFLFAPLRMWIVIQEKKEPLFLSLEVLVDKLSSLRS